MMTLTHWQPRKDMEFLRRQFDQMVEELAPTHEVARPWVPAIELTSNEAEFTVRVQLPGIDAKDIEVQVGRKALSIAGEHQFEQKTEENGYFRSEFRYGKFQRVIALPAPIQNDQAKAEFKDGILTLTLPRLQAVQPAVVTLNLVEQPETLPAEPAAAPKTETTEDAWA